MSSSDRKKHVSRRRLLGLLVGSACAAPATSALGAWPPTPRRKPGSRVGTTSATTPPARPERAGLPVRPRIADQIPEVGQLRQVISYANAREAGLNAARRAVLDALLGEMQREPGRRLHIRSYASTASGGDIPARRRALGRAEAVRDHLIARGLPKHRLIIFSRPAGSNDSAAERVELIMVP